MQGELAQGILDRVDSLAAKLGVAAEHVWPLLIRQVYVEFWMLSAVWGMSVIALIAALAHDFDDPDVEIMARAFAIMSCAILFCIWALVGVIPVLNPEYAALKKILP